VGGNAWMTAFACNLIELESRKLPTPKGYSDLVDSRYKGLITMPNPASSGTGFLTVSGILQRMGEEAGWKYLDALHANISTYEHSGSKPAKLAASGECAIGISFCYASIQQQKKGAPLVVVFPTEGSGWEVEATALVKKPKISPDAKRFVDWASSADAVTLYGKAYAVLSRPDVQADTRGYPADIQSQLIPNDLDWAAGNRDRILAEWTRRYGGGG
jgi:iron(III) transport system substrate-binding protein